MRYTPREEGGDTPQLHPRQVEVQGWFGKQVRRHTHSRTDEDEGYELLKRFLDKELGEKKIYKMISRWEMLEDCERSQGESTQAFVDRYVRAYEAAKSVCGVTIPPQMKAFMLLRRLRVKDEIRRALILSKLDHEREEEMYDQMETQILEVMGGGPGRRTTSRGLTRREAYILYILCCSRDIVSTQASQHSLSTGNSTD